LLNRTAGGGCPYVIFARRAREYMPKNFYRRKLPHLQRDDKFHFVTFCTYKRWILSDSARDIVLGCCLHDNNLKLVMHAVVVMPDHVHIIFVPMANAVEVFSLAQIMGAIKSASAHKINQSLDRTGKVWQTESFDYVLRSSESLDQKITYVLENPVRSGLVSVSSDYRWLWQPLVNPHTASLASQIPATLT
jgi:REP-associated tyrosine transposase